MEARSPRGIRVCGRTGWGISHGLSMLLLGPHSGVPLDERSALIDECLDDLIENHHAVGISTHDHS